VWAAPDFKGTMLSRPKNQEKPQLTKILAAMPYEQKVVMGKAAGMLKKNYKLKKRARVDWDV
jgi:hypothetical protein